MAYYVTYHDFAGAAYANDPDLDYIAIRKRPLVHRYYSDVYGLNGTPCIEGNAYPCRIGRMEVRVECHGKFQTLTAAQKHIEDVFGSTRLVDQNGEKFDDPDEYDSADDYPVALKIFKIGKYRPAGSEDLAALSEEIQNEILSYGGGRLHGNEDEDELQAIAKYYERRARNEECLTFGGADNIVGLIEDVIQQLREAGELEEDEEEENVD